MDVDTDCTGRSVDFRQNVILEVAPELPRGPHARLSCRRGEGLDSLKRVRGQVAATVASLLFTQLSAGTSPGSWGPIFFRASLVDDQRSSTELFAIQAFYGRAAFRIIAHRHECETSWLACFSIGYDLNLRDAPKLFEHMLEVSFSDGERNISNVEFHSVMGLYAIACCRAVPESRVSNHH